MLLLHRGELDDAVAEGNAGLIRAEELESWTYVPELCAVVAEANAYRGSLVARRQLRRGISAVGEPRSVGAQRLAWATAVVDETVGEDASLVLEHLASLYEPLPDGLQVLAFDPMVGPRLVGLAKRADDAERAGTAAEATDSLSRVNHGVISLDAAGMQAGGLLDGDVDRLVAAARAFEASPRPLARARADEDAARGLLQQSRRAEAVEYLEPALAEYERAGCGRTRPARPRATRGRRQVGRRTINSQAARLRLGEYDGGRAPGRTTCSDRTHQPRHRRRARSVSAHGGVAPAARLSQTRRPVPSRTDPCRPDPRTDDRCMTIA